MKNTKYGSHLLTIENAKTVKGESLGWLTGILYLAPSYESVQFGGFNTCPHASNGCRASCLFTAGRGRFDDIRQARINKTLYLQNERENFFNDLRQSIKMIIRKANREGLKPAVRLNGTSDIAWEKTGIMEEFPNVQFYDYTKDMQRALDFSLGLMPQNYHLTFSQSEINGEIVERLSALGGINIAVVFASGLPESYLNRKVVCADEHDLRFLDEKNVVCGLTAKGKAKKDSSGFVVKS